MKKYAKYAVLVFGVLLLSLVFAYPALAQGVEPPVETPPLTIEQFPWMGVLLLGGVTFLVTLGLKSLSGAFGIDLSGKASAITAALVLAIGELINTLLSTIPPEAIPAVVSGLGFVFALLSAFGFAGLLKKATTKPDAPKVENKPLLEPQKTGKK